MPLSSSSADRRIPEALSAIPAAESGKTSTTAATPAAKSAFEISRARQSPNAAAMISIARGNEVNTKPAHTKSFRPDVSM